MIKTAILPATLMLGDQGKVGSGTSGTRVVSRYAYITHNLRLSMEHWEVGDQGSDPVFEALVSSPKGTIITGVFRLAGTTFYTGNRQQKPGEKATPNWDVKLRPYLLGSRVMAVFIPQAEWDPEFRGMLAADLTGNLIAQRDPEVSGQQVVRITHPDGVKDREGRGGVTATTEVTMDFTERERYQDEDGSTKWRNKANAPQQRVKVKAYGKLAEILEGKPTGTPIQVIADSVNVRAWYTPDGEPTGCLEVTARVLNLLDRQPVAMTGGAQEVVEDDVVHEDIPF